jgi:hypothetical protein
MWQVHINSMSFSCHLCGKWVADLMENNLSILEIIKQKTYHGTQPFRVQINLGNRFIDIDKLFEHGIGLYAGQVILQVKDFSRYDFIKEGSLRPGFYVPLFDLSGGRGTLPAEWIKPLDGVYCGYAGGLGPHNLEEQLEKLAEVVGDREIWVDMETHIRDTEEVFSLAKVETCLEIIQKWT